MEDGVISDKKHIKIVVISLAAGILATVVMLFLLAAFARYDALVKDTSGNFFRARSLFIAGNLFICSRDASNCPTKQGALQAKDTGRSLSFVSMKQVEYIEITGGKDEEGPALGAWQPSLKDYVGDYTVNAAGNHGYLSLRASGGYLYGTIRFPDWGRGATEYLKNVRIYNGKLYFTRSVSTQQELRRVGANAYFTQQYSGEYLRGGNLIRGYYIVNKERKQWEAYRNR
ncbi:MAG TPA: hypothetical protein PLM53_17300 [Spirochaetota bacterium]|nr:hypothetical protein [Spirochaetota bacterium]HQH98855.1 hypothetical protein [Spirochaetota bacterium]